MRVCGRAAEALQCGAAAVSSSCAFPQKKNADIACAGQHDVRAPATHVRPSEEDQHHQHHHQHSRVVTLFSSSKARLTMSPGNADASGIHLEAESAFVFP